MLPTGGNDRCEADVFWVCKWGLPLLVIESCNALIALSTSSIFAANSSTGPKKHDFKSARYGRGTQKSGL